MHLQYILLKQVHLSRKITEGKWLQHTHSPKPVSSTRKNTLSRQTSSETILDNIHQESYICATDSELYYA